MIWRCSMLRRRFLKETLAAGILVAGSTGGIFGKRAWARSQLSTQLLNDAIPDHSANIRREIDAYPARAREAMRCFFHERCLNVEPFVAHVLTSSFKDRLSRCRDQAERQSC